MDLFGVIVTVGSVEEVALVDVAVLADARPRDVVASTQEIFHPRQVLQPVWMVDQT